MLAIVAVLSGCGGGDGGGGSGATGGGTITSTPAPTASPTQPPSATACSLTARKQWALAQLNEWYLFPDSLAGSIDPTQFNNLDDYVDALVAPARAERKDRYFTHVGSIAEENAFYANGTSAGLGIQLQAYSNPALVVVDA
jgi:carboxyl-terminal processing protease